MQRLVRVAAAVGLAVAVAAGVVQLAAPLVMESAAAAAARSWLGEGHYRVDLEAVPRYRLLLGAVDRLQVTGTDLAAAGAVDRLVVTLFDVRVELWTLLRERRLEASRARRIDLRLELTEQDLAQQLRAVVPFEDLTVALRDGRFALDGRLPAWRGAAHVQVEGVVEPVEPPAAQVRLTVTRLRVNDREVPSILIVQVVPVLLRPGLVVDLGGIFPRPVRFHTVGVGEGRLILDGEVEP